MDKLQFFLDNPIETIEKDIKVSDRLPFTFKVRPMTNEEYSLAQKKCTKYVKGQTIFESGKFNAMISSMCCLDPDFSDAKAIKDAKCTTPSEFISKVLLVGEISTIAEEVVKLSGFTGITEDIETAKNL